MNPIYLPGGKAMVRGGQFILNADDECCCYPCGVNPLVTGSPSCCYRKCSQATLSIALTRPLPTVDTAGLDWTTIPDGSGNAALAWMNANLGTIVGGVATAAVNHGPWTGYGFHAGRGSFAGGDPPTLPVTGGSSFFWTYPTGTEPFTNQGHRAECYHICSSDGSFPYGWGGMFQYTVPSGQPFAGDIYQIEMHSIVPQGATPAPSPAGYPGLISWSCCGAHAKHVHGTGAAGSPGTVYMRWTPAGQAQKTIGSSNWGGIDETDIASVTLLNNLCCSAGGTCIRTTSQPADCITCSEQAAVPSTKLAVPVSPVQNDDSAQCLVCDFVDRCPAVVRCCGGRIDRVLPCPMG